MKYRGYTIEHIFPPIPIRQFDWGFYREDDAGDCFSGYAATAHEARNEIDELIAESMEPE